MAKDKPHLSALDKLVMSAIGDNKALGKEDDPARESCPTLWQWLTQTAAGKDYVMQPAKLQIAMTVDGVTVTITHPDIMRATETTCNHLSECFAAIEAALTSPQCVFRKWGRKEPTLRKRKKDS